MTYDDLSEIVNGFYNVDNNSLDIQYIDFGTDAIDIANLFQNILNLTNVVLSNAL
ncbi:MAG: hypothetical protein JKY48_18095 [Flavobacteriales bacterium]|nr:hypothetical protein [Flavobacteriales bacterium]